MKAAQASLFAGECSVTFCAPASEQQCRKSSAGVTANPAPPNALDGAMIDLQLVNRHGTRSWNSADGGGGGHIEMMEPGNGTAASHHPTTPERWISIYERRRSDGVKQWSMKQLRRSSASMRTI